MVVMDEKKYSDAEVRDAIRHVAKMAHDAFDTEPEQAGRNYAAGWGAYDAAMGALEHDPDLVRLFAKKFREVHE